jgi:hypothetical protein
MINAPSGRSRLKSATVWSFLRLFQIAGVTIFSGLALLDEGAQSP